MSSRKSFRFLFSLVSLFLLLFLLVYFFTGEAKARQIQKGIADEIIRFHVIANGNTYDEQVLKYKVKDALVNELSPLLEEAKSKGDALKIIESQINEIKLTAEKVVRENASINTVSVSITNTYFPMKVYGSYTFPPGNYDALQVKIGKAKGENWWCVLFPPLCFVDETYSIVDEETGDQLQYLLTDDEYHELLSDKEIRIRYKIKLWELFKDWFFT